VFQGIPQGARKYRHGGRQRQADRRGVLRMDAGQRAPAIQEKVDAMGEDAEGLAGVKTETEKAEQATRDLIAANDRLSGRLLAQEEANTAYYEASDKFKEYVKSATGGIDQQTDAGRKNREEIKKMAKATRDKADADLEATGDVGEFTNTLWNQRKALIEAAEKMGANTEEAEELANTVLEIPKSVTTKADLKDWASKKAEEIQEELKKIERKIDIDVAIKYYEDKSKHSDLQTKNPGARIPAPPTRQGHDGYVLEAFADGGLKPMEPIAQMVKPNTWRVVGDRMKDDEAYIPLDGSPRSKAILMEAIVRMPNLMHDGGILNFAAGGVAAAAGDAEAKVDPATGEVDSSAITEAFASLTALLGESWNGLLTDMLGKTEAFFGQLLAITVAQNAGLLAAHQASNAAI